MFDRNNGSMFSGGVGTALRKDCLSDMFVCVYRLFRVLFGGVRYIRLGDDSGIEFVEDGISGVSVHPACDCFYHRLDGCSDVEDDVSDVSDSVRVSVRRGLGDSSSNGYFT